MSEGLHPEQVNALRKMTPAERLQAGMVFIDGMHELRENVLRQDHPQWTEEQISRALRDFVLHASS